MSRLKNTIRMLNILSTRFVVPISELASTLEVSDRTIQRMRDDLLDLGYEIESHFGPTGGLKLIGASSFQPLDFTLSEQENIRHGIKYLLSLEAQTFGDEFFLALSKLNQRFDATQSTRIIETVNTVRLNVDGQLYQKMISTLEKAIEAHQRVQIVYNKNRREKRNYKFEPYELILVNQLWYVVGYDERSRQLTLKISRIESIDVLNETFRFDSYFSNHIGLNDFGFKIEKVALEVIVSNLDSISESVWGKNQKITWLDDARFKLDVEFQNMLSAKEFILKGGHNFEVIKPLVLRTWIYEEAEKIKEKY